MSVYLDTSAVLAVLNPNDKFHLSAREQWQTLLESATLLVCSNYVLLETLALVQRRMGLDAVRTVIADVVPILQVEWVSPTEHWAAVQLWLSLNRRQVSLVDCVSFVQMRRLGIQEVFTFDPHFAEQGFTCLP
ncbi:MAG: PIN domain-containing protein [Armatimonadetes bacterium]|nr:PIN domain-containing protein [Armatimonadota bacterium]CUU34079.1 Predicted nucleic acid-binding protein, contains PIN domain [Armatimonadetes bacterium DC]